MQALVPARARAVPDSCMRSKTTILIIHKLHVSELHAGGHSERRRQHACTVTAAHRGSHTARASY